jgi:hypothetical protein
MDSAPRFSELRIPVGADVASAESHYMRLPEHARRVVAFILQNIAPDEASLPTTEARFFDLHMGDPEMQAIADSFFSALWQPNPSKGK